MVIITAKSFANSFWGRDDVGFEVLTSKMSSGKKTCEELRAFYNLKATLHDDLGRKLLKHVRMGLGRDETGTLKNLLDTTRKEIELNAQANVDMATKIRNNLEVPLENFMLEQKDKRKLVQTTVDKAHRNKQLHAAYVMKQYEKAKEKYDSECGKHANLESQLASTSARDADRLRLKIERCKAEVDTLDNEYQSACLKLTEATAIWNAEWKIACDRYQEMEEMRIEFLRESFMTYVNIVSGLSVDERESLERITNCVGRTDITQDIDSFIDEQGTGPMIPEPPVYTNFFADRPEPIPKYQIAKFAPITVPDNTKFNDTRQSSFSQYSEQVPALPPKSPREPAIKSPIAKMIKDDKATEKLLQRRANLYSSTDKTMPKTTPVPPPPPSKSKSKKAIPIINLPGDDNQSDDNDDHDVDPRANILVNLGGNVFEIDNTEGDDSSLDTLTAAQERRTKRRAPQTQRLDEAFDVSISDLLQELGVHEKKRTSPDNEKNVAAVPEAHSTIQHEAEHPSHEIGYDQYQPGPMPSYTTSNIYHPEQHYPQGYEHNQTAYYTNYPQEVPYTNYEQTYSHQPNNLNHYNPGTMQDTSYYPTSTHYTPTTDPHVAYAYPHSPYTNETAEHQTPQHYSGQQWTAQADYNTSPYYHG
ncbi:hypothetical protein INT44_004034 [Umbelopsis vinacea]|uniref:F-BAR domain-containing protein n=1 Tax=Umbelopsis vinacea TaxID=44442 RepID=A0A8H7Q9H7_9FUNG|nr:hypothetical protein INT44_004034 [Umbelopsis vinacea]